MKKTSSPIPKTPPIGRGVPAPVVESPGEAPQPAVSSSAVELSAITAKLEGLLHEVERGMQHPSHVDPPHALPSWIREKERPFLSRDGLALDEAIGSFEQLCKEYHSAAETLPPESKEEWTRMGDEWASPPSGMDATELPIELLLQGIPDSYEDDRLIYVNNDFVDSIISSVGATLPSQLQYKSVHLHSHQLMETLHNVRHFSIHIQSLLVHSAKYGIQLDGSYLLISYINGSGEVDKSVLEPVRLDLNELLQQRVRPGMRAVDKFPNKFNAQFSKFSSAHVRKANLYTKYFVGDVSFPKTYVVFPMKIDDQVARDWLENGAHLRIELCSYLFEDTASSRRSPKTTSAPTRGRKMQAFAVAKVPLAGLLYSHSPNAAARDNQLKELDEILASNLFSDSPGLGENAATNGKYAAFDALLHASLVTEDSIAKVLQSRWELLSQRQLNHAAQQLYKRERPLSQLGLLTVRLQLLAGTRDGVHRTVIAHETNLRSTALPQNHAIPPAIYQPVAVAATSATASHPSRDAGSTADKSERLHEALQYVPQPPKSASSTRNTLLDPLQAARNPPSSKYTGLLVCAIRNLHLPPQLTAFKDTHEWQLVLQYKLSPTEVDRLEIDITRHHRFEGGAWNVPVLRFKVYESARIRLSPLPTFEVWLRTHSPLTQAPEQRLVAYTVASMSASSLFADTVTLPLHSPFLTAQALGWLDLRFLSGETTQVVQHGVTIAAETYLRDAEEASRRETADDMERPRGQEEDSRSECSEDSLLPSLFSPSLPPSGLPVQLPGTEKGSVERFRDDDAQPALRKVPPASSTAREWRYDRDDEDEDLQSVHSEDSLEAHPSPEPRWTSPPSTESDLESPRSPLSTAPVVTRAAEAAPSTSPSSSVQSHVLDLSIAGICDELYNTVSYETEMHPYDSSVRGLFVCYSLGTSQPAQLRPDTVLVSHSRSSGTRVVYRTDTQVLYWDSECAVLNTQLRHCFDAAWTADSFSEALGVNPHQGIIFHMLPCTPEGDLPLLDDAQFIAPCASAVLPMTDLLAAVHGLAETATESTILSLPVCLAGDVSSHASWTLPLRISHRIQPVHLHSASTSIPLHSLLPQAQPEQTTVLSRPGESHSDREEVQVGVPTASNRRLELTSPPHLPAGLHEQARHDFHVVVTIDQMRHLQSSVIAGASSLATTSPSLQSMVFFTAQVVAPSGSLIPATVQCSTVRSLQEATAVSLDWHEQLVLPLSEEQAHSGDWTLLVQLYVRTTLFHGSVLEMTPAAGLRYYNLDRDPLDRSIDHATALLLRDQDLLEYTCDSIFRYNQPSSSSSPLPPSTEARTRSAQEIQQVRASDQLLGYAVVSMSKHILHNDHYQGWHHLLAHNLVHGHMPREAPNTVFAKMDTGDIAYNTKPIAQVLLSLEVGTDGKEHPLPLPPVVDAVYIDQARKSEELPTERTEPAVVDDLLPLKSLEEADLRRALEAMQACTQALAQMRSPDLAVAAESSPVPAPISEEKEARQSPFDDPFFGCSPTQPEDILLIPRPFEDSCADSRQEVDEKGEDVEEEDVEEKDQFNRSSLELWFEEAMESRRTVPVEEEDDYWSEAVGQQGITQEVQEVPERSHDITCPSVEEGEEWQVSNTSPALLEESQLEGEGDSEADVDISSMAAKDLEVLCETPEPDYVEQELAEQEEESPAHPLSDWQPIAAQSSPSPSPSPSPSLCASSHDTFDYTRSIDYSHDANGPSGHLVPGVGDISFAEREEAPQGQDLEDGSEGEGEDQSEVKFTLVDESVGSAEIFADCADVDTQTTPTHFPASPIDAASQPATETADSTLQTELDPPPPPLIVSQQDLEAVVAKQVDSLLHRMAHAAPAPILPFSGERKSTDLAAGGSMPPRAEQRLHVSCDWQPDDRPQHPVEPSRSHGVNTLPATSETPALPPRGDAPGSLHDLIQRGLQRCGALQEPDTTSLRKSLRRRQFADAEAQRVADIMFGSLRRQSGGLSM